MNWDNIGLLLWIGSVCLVIQMQSKLVCENLAPMFMHVNTQFTFISWNVCSYRSSWDPTFVVLSWN
jgi:hypothetical protein